MSDHSIFPDNLIAPSDQSSQNPIKRNTQQASQSDPTLPVLITRDASKQTYYTIRFLVDRRRTLDAYRAYAYFRWLDDMLDQGLSTRDERLAFAQRQQALMNGFYQGKRQSNLSAEERILDDLIRTDQKQNSGLQAYLRNMMAVMVFDADRRGRLISQTELTTYSMNLSRAVTEALHYFIGHDDPSPQTPERYLAVIGAHITHMLRDTFEDMAAGYFNISCEFLDAHKLNPCDVTSDSYKLWVKNRLQLARIYFKAGKAYLAQIRNLRCRIAGYAYIARFEEVLNTIEHEGCQLRAAYPERKSLSGGLKVIWSTFSMLSEGLIRGRS